MRHPYLYSIENRDRSLPIFGIIWRSDRARSVGPPNNSKNGGRACWCAILHTGHPQQPAKGALSVSESLTRRVKRFTTKPTGACSVARLKGEQTGKEPMGRNENEPHQMSPVSLKATETPSPWVTDEGRSLQARTIALACKLRWGRRGRHVGKKRTR